MSGIAKIFMWLSGSSTRLTGVVTGAALLYSGSLHRQAARGVEQREAKAKKAAI
jgi:hypothetical protein